MANETNKNRDDRKDKVGNPSSGKTKAPGEGAPLRGDVPATNPHTGEAPGTTPSGTGRRGNISSEDGGDISGNSAGSH
ncbi:hypothetical protein [Rufibacter hautae]|uniref:Uncharacterized protein n=1 Tax=Rufibacter hautae TaxID=2595005 RepID=A0A5B6TDI8_9BACT|nr:hypothetical protein [Rufibacter hautae]KAA3438529.1 hypothetical protein FOA19_14960 [Rufibacter hautae]